MKKNVLLSLVSILIFVGNMNAQCYTTEESSAVDFWLDHFYGATCTDYAGAGGSKLFSEDNTYVDFNGGSSVIFDNIYVSKDGVYTAKLNYGIGWADAEGAKLNLYVNDEFVSVVTLFTLPEGQERPAQIDIPLELFGDWNNVVKFTQVKDWCIFQGIQLSSGTSSIEQDSTDKYTVNAQNGILSIKNFEKGSNRIDVFTLRGETVDTKTVNEEYSKSLTPGLYLVKVNGDSFKVLVK